jgi:hypothetical protein
LKLIPGGPSEIVLFYSYFDTFKQKICRILTSSLSGAATLSYNKIAIVPQPRKDMFGIRRSKKQNVPYSDEQAALEILERILKEEFSELYSSSTPAGDSTYGEALQQSLGQWAARVMADHSTREEHGKSRYETREEQRGIDY